MLKISETQPDAMRTYKYTAIELKYKVIIPVPLPLFFILFKRISWTNRRDRVWQYIAQIMRIASMRCCEEITTCNQKRHLSSSMLAGEVFFNAIARFLLLINWNYTKEAGQEQRWFSGFLKKQRSRNVARRAIVRLVAYISVSTLNALISDYVLALHCLSVEQNLKRAYVRLNCLSRL